MSGIVEGKVALVTGAASGIGRASACTFAREGARVVVSDVNEAGLRETAQQVEKEGGEASVFAADVASEDDVQALVVKSARQQIAGCWCHC